MIDLTTLSDDELAELAQAISVEVEGRLPLDPEPWTWDYTWESPPRRRWGPQNDGMPHPHGRLSKIIPRKGYRQDPEAYWHTIKPIKDFCDDPNHGHPWNVKD